MRILMIGVSHHTAPVDVREKLADAAADPERLLTQFADRRPRTECMILSTCNRMEFYIARPSHESPSPDDLKNDMSLLCRQPRDLIDTYCIVREQEQALRHLFRVTCGLDSMVLGENQVTGQVKQAYETAIDTGTVGPVLHQVFQQALAVSKQLQKTTTLRHGRHSIGSVAVAFACRTFGDIHDKTVLCIGTGEMAGCIVNHLQNRGVKTIMLIGRTKANADTLATQISQSGQPVRVYDWHRLDELIQQADILISATGSEKPVITTRHFKRSACPAQNRPVMIIDIAVPRDVEPEVGSISNVHLFNIDALQSMVDRTMLCRYDEVDKCETAITEAVINCMTSIRTRDIGGLIRQLRQKLHALGRAEQSRTLKKLSPLIPPEHPDVVGSILAEHTYRVINKILHLPLSQLNQRDRESPLGFYAAAIRRLFQLEESFLADKQDMPDQPDSADPENAEEPDNRTRPHHNRAEATKTH